MFGSVVPSRMRFVNRIKNRLCDNVIAACVHIRTHSLKFTYDNIDRNKGAL